VANADAQVATTASLIPFLEAAARQSIYALGILLGQEPAALVAELSRQPPSRPHPFSAGRTALGSAAPAARHPPAEAEIHAATARIGVATADLFPNSRFPVRRECARAISAPG